MGQARTVPHNGEWKALKWTTIHITAFKTVRRDCTDINPYMYVLKQLITSLVPLFHLMHTQPEEQRVGLGTRLVYCCLQCTLQLVDTR